MKTLKVGIVGFGFIGPHHMDAIRRLGFADVVAIATSSYENARELAQQHYVERAHRCWQDLVNDPTIDVVDVTTPTHLHAEIAIAAARAGKHVIVDKPMALTVADAERMTQAAETAGVVHAVTFNIRYNTMLQQARAMIGNGELGALHFVQGHYWQEWLLKESDYNWRIEDKFAGPLAMVADAGAHWYDIAQHLTGLRIVRVLADLSRFIDVRKRPTTDGGVEDFPVEIADLGMVMFQFANGARGLFSTGAMHAGHKNDLTIEVFGGRASLRWQQELPCQLWVGKRDEPNQTILKDPGLLDPSIQSYSALPGGHNEAWPDAFRNLMRNILTFIRDGRDPMAADGVAFPTFQTGLNVTRIVESISKSAEAGGAWIEVATD